MPVDRGLRGETVVALLSLIAMLSAPVT